MFSFTSSNGGWLEFGVVTVALNSLTQKLKYSVSVTSSITHMSIVYSVLVDRLISTRTSLFGVRFTSWQQINRCMTDSRRTCHSTIVQVRRLLCSWADPGTDYGERVERELVWERSPSGVQGQSPWSRIRGDVPWSWKLFVHFNTKEGPKVNIFNALLGFCCACAYLCVLGLLPLFSSVGGRLVRLCLDPQCLYSLL